MVLRTLGGEAATKKASMIFLQLAEGKSARQVADDLELNYQYVLRKASRWRDEGIFVMHRSGKCGHYSLTLEGERFVGQE